VGATGAASFELPLPLSAGRGWDPQLSLTYSSQTGNGPFGIGWSLGIGQISRVPQKVYRVIAISMKSSVTTVKSGCRN
jgi:hypothetical protein